MYLTGTIAHVDPCGVSHMYTVVIPEGCKHVHELIRWARLGIATASPRSLSLLPQACSKVRQSCVATSHPPPALDQWMQTFHTYAHAMQ